MFEQTHKIFRGLYQVCQYLQVSTESMEERLVKDESERIPKAVIVA